MPFLGILYDDPLTRNNLPSKWHRLSSSPVNQLPSDGNDHQNHTPGLLTGENARCRRDNLFVHDFLQIPRATVERGCDDVNIEYKD